ncbi:membrane protein [Amylibacter marinus]|uniref:Membrane protein n=1 Tax=Amylibacter marinus TaxID=1475483 RepID=A0ABQ5VXA6_9RHOB|nr:DUF805 domain-containing protein [Amylibacter marinus]GLQ35913.1 membrane protein [Amylibacter marinus]
MNMIEAVKSVLNNYANFNGRAPRSEYWWWILALTIVNFILSGLLLSSMDFSNLATSPNPGLSSFMSFGGILMLVFYLATIIPTLAVGARRLHDSGKSGWLQLIYVLTIIPLVGLIVLIVMIYLFTLKSEEGSNKYG